MVDEAQDDDVCRRRRRGPPGSRPAVVVRPGQADGLDHDVAGADERARRRVQARREQGGSLTRRSGQRTFGRCTRAHLRLELQVEAQASRVIERPVAGLDRLGLLRLLADGLVAGAGERARQTTGGRHRGDVVELGDHDGVAGRFGQAAEDRGRQGHDGLCRARAVLVRRRHGPPERRRRTFWTAAAAPLNPTVAGCDPRRCLTKHESQTRTKPWSGDSSQRFDEQDLQKSWPHRRQ